MYQLVIAVLSITLLALVVAGGASYMSPDWGSRRVAAELATLSYQSFDAALAAYRASNGGVLPPAASGGPSRLSGGGLPWPLIKPYLGGRSEADSRIVSLTPFQGMDWYYVADSAGAALCLASRSTDGGAPVTPAIRAGLRQSAERASLAFVGSACLERNESAVAGQGDFAVTYRIPSGS